MRAAVKGTLQFSSSLQLVPGLVELHAYEFRSRWVSFTWFIGQENVTVDSREKRLQEGVTEKGRAPFCVSHT